MKNAFVLYLTIFSALLSAKEYSLQLPINLVCPKGDSECIEKFQKEENDIILELTDPTDPNKKKKKLKVRLHFGAVRHAYKNTDINIQLDNGTNLNIQNVPIKERHNMEYFKFWDLPEYAQSVFQFIDEPTNTFVLSLEKGTNEFSLTYVHPKYLISWVWDTHEHHDPQVHISGTHQGQAIDQLSNLASGSDNSNIPSFPEFRNTFGHAQISLGYGKILNILKSENNNFNLSYTPNLSLGVHVGNAFVDYRPNPNEQIETNRGFNKRIGFQGASITAGQRLKFSTLNDRFGIFVEHKFNYSKKKYPILDRGTVAHDLKYNSLSLGIHIKLRGK